MPIVALTQCPASLGCICYETSRRVWRSVGAVDKQLKTELREAQTQYLTEMFSGDTNRLNKKAWSYIKSRRRDNVGIPPLRNANGRLCEEAHEKAEIMAKQYNSVFTKDNPHVPTPEILYCLPRMPEITIDVNGVMKLLQELKVNKAPGPDLIPNRVLKECYITSNFHRYLQDYTEHR